MEGDRGVSDCDVTEQRELTGNLSAYLPFRHIAFRG